MRLIRPEARDSNTGVNAKLRRIASCHEAAHALAAYHLRFPIVCLKFQEPTNGQVANTHVESDLAAFNIAIQFLAGIGAARQKMLVALCAVMAIARWTNIHVNLVDLKEAESYSISDYQQMNDYLQKLSLKTEDQAWFVQQGEAEAKRIIELAGYREALDAVAAQLIQTGEVRDFEVAMLTEQVADQQLRSAARNPKLDEVSLAAYYRQLDRIRNGQAGDSLDDWIVAERGIWFGIASVT